MRFLGINVPHWQMSLLFAAVDSQGPSWRSRSSGATLPLPAEQELVYNPLAVLSSAKSRIAPSKPIHKGSGERSGTRQENMDTLLVLDANQRSALAATRSLGAKGITVITADSTPRSLAGSSRYATAYIRYPSPHEDPEAFVTALITMVNQHRIGTMLSMTDVTAGLVLQHRDRFPAIAIPLPDRSAYEQLSDKGKLASLAQALGVRSPATHLLAGHETLADLDGKMPLPAVIKPVRSRTWCGEQCVSAPVQYVESDDAARAAVVSARKRGPVALLVQEYIPGEGRGIFCLYDRGRPHTFFSHRRVREKPPWGGVSVLSESVATDREMRAMAEALLTHVGWHGVAMVEFKVRADGTPFLIEVNGRFWGSLQLAIDAGIDFPHLLYRLGKGQPPEPVSSYRIGQRLRWLLGDLDSLYLTLKARGGPGSVRRKLQALRSFATFFQPQLRYEINRLDDLGPFLYELREYLR